MSLRTGCRFAWAIQRSREPSAQDVRRGAPNSPLVHRASSICDKIHIFSMREERIQFINPLARTPRKDWRSVRKRACVETQPRGMSRGVDPTPRRSRRTGARVSEGPGSAGPVKTRGSIHVHQALQDAAPDAAPLGSAMIVILSQNRTLRSPRRKRSLAN
jgi:hypothetical protein